MDLPCQLLLSHAFTVEYQDSKKPADKKKGKDKDKSSPTKEKTMTKSKGPPGSQWNVDDVCDWLQSMELAEYQVSFPSILSFLPSFLSCFVCPGLALFLFLFSPCA